jgi:hypothetical protein
MFAAGALTAVVVALTGAGVVLVTTVVEETVVATGFVPTIRMSGRP